MTSASETSIAAPGVSTAAPVHSPLRETWQERLHRYVLGVAWSLKPPRTWGAPAAVWMVVSHYAGLRDVEEGVPDPENALKRPDGLVGICCDLSPETLMEGYRAGLFPFCHIGPQKWWAPSTRMVLRLTHFHMEKNLRRALRKKHFTVTFDRAFEDVIRGCAEPRQGRPKLTWITPEMIEVYIALHDAGHAHSVEVWDGAGNLAGGAYGVAAGQMFFTESQFSRQRDASKVGFATLNCHLQKWGFVLNDGKFHSGHLAQAGFELMPRSQFNALLARHCRMDAKGGPWEVDKSLNIGSWDPAAGMAQFERNPS